MNHKASRPTRKETKVPQSSELTVVADEDVPTASNDTLSGKDKLKLVELMTLCIYLSSKVCNLKTTKTAQAKEITTLKKRVNKLERRKKSGSIKLKRLFKVGYTARLESSRDEETVLGDQEDASKQGRSIDNIDEDARVTLDNTTFADKDLFGVHDLEGEEVFADEEVRKTVDEEMTLAQTLMDIKIKAKGIVMEEPSNSAPIITSQQPSQVNAKDKGKAMMIEEHVKLKRKDQIAYDASRTITCKTGRRS
ncbi:hypothetical protein Tco_1531516 [Tanacetum coccineum]